MFSRKKFNFSKVRKFKTNGYVMVCEDNLDSKLLLIKTLHKLGVTNIMTFENTEKLYEHIINATKLPDVLLLDIGMPKGIIKGDVMCEKLRKEGYEFPIIAVTGLVTFEDIQDFIEKRGFNQVITKPYKINRLIEALNKYI